MEDKINKIVEDKGNKIINSVERVLRYLMPGVAFCILFALSYPNAFSYIFCKISDNNLFVFLIILSIGMSIYIIHSQVVRFTLERYVYWKRRSPVNIFSDNESLCNYSKAHADLIIFREKAPYYPKEKYIYLWAIIHYSFMMSYLLLFFAFRNEEKSWVDSYAIYIGIGGFLIFLLSIGSYLYMQDLEKDTTAAIKNLNETTPK